VKLKDLIDPLLHVPLAAVVAFGFYLDIGIGAALFLWIREAAQLAPSSLVRGLDLRQYSLQKHLEIWPPSILLSLLYHFFL
jgi:hypothetical protein